MSGTCRAVDASAGGLFLVTPGPGFLAGASLRATGADATVTLRDGGAGGAVIGLLAAQDGFADHFAAPGLVIYTGGGVHVTVTGAGAEVILFGN